MLSTANATRWNRSLAATTTKPSRTQRHRPQANPYPMTLTSYTPSTRHGEIVSTPSRMR